MSRPYAISCIYYIFDIKNEKLYIGYASDYYKRVGVHKSKLKKNKHDNKYLQKAWDEFGEENLEFNIFQYCPKEKLIENEIFFIKFFKTNYIKYGYNLTSGGDGCFGYNHTESHKKYMSNFQKGNTYALGYHLTDEQ